MGVVWSNGSTPVYNIKGEWAEGVLGLGKENGWAWLWFVFGFDLWV